MKPRLKRDLPIALLALALLASVVAGREKPTLEILEEKNSKVKVEEDFDISGLQRQESGGPQADPFARRSFAAPQAGAAPAQRVAPPLPFRYMGKLVENGKLEVFVLRGAEHFSVTAGQKIDNDYRVEKVTDTEIVFTYLPLKTRQALEL